MGLHPADDLEDDSALLPVPAALLRAGHGEGNASELHRAALNAGGRWTSCPPACSIELHRHRAHEVPDVDGPPRGDGRRKRACARASARSEAALAAGGGIKG